jgi:excisionase family DNA binding protein
MEPLVMSVEDAGRALGIGRQLAYDLARSGRIPVIRLGKRLVVPRAECWRSRIVQRDSHEKCRGPAGAHRTIAPPSCCAW